MADFFTSTLFIFAPVVGYVSQYQDIKKTSNCEGFSNRVCLILLLSNILRCYFWIGKQFDITLLYQSIVMIIAQITMLHLTVSIKSRESKINKLNNNNINNKIINSNNDSESPNTPPLIEDNQILEIDTTINNNDDDDDNNNNNNNNKITISDNNINSNISTNFNNNYNFLFLNTSGYFNKFWEWDSFVDYLIFLCGYSCFFLLLTTVYFYSPTYFEYLGTLSLTIESILGLPQLIQNYKKRSTKGLSLVLIGTWFIGDLFKTLFFIYKSQPTQFIFCGIVQLAIDILICLQIFYYNK